MASPLQNAIDFLREFGLFDIVLPFLLVFTLVFAILEKTKVLGVEKDEKTPKKNLNAMVAFVFAMIVVATNKIVTTINMALPNVVLLLVVFVAFLLLVGLFSKTGELDFKERHPKYYSFFIFISVVTIFFIFLGSINTSSGQSWLNFAWDYVANNFEGAAVSSLIFLVILIGAIYWVIGNPKNQNQKSGG